MLWLLLSALLAAPLAWAQAPAAAERADPTLPPEPCVSRPDHGPEMVLIAGGTFLMGSPLMGSPDSDDEAYDTERPPHEVTVRPFALARCETTVGEFRRFVEDTGYETAAEREGDCYALDAAGVGFGDRAGAYWDAPGFPQTDDHPVVCVSFDDALAYARWLGARTGAVYRLPTEAEWELAARAGEAGPRPWLGGVDAGCAHANGADLSAQARFADWTVMNCDDGHVFTAPAGSYRRSAFGLSDMLGNAWEWVEDCWHDAYDGAPTDGSAWLETDGGECARRVVRGGSWSSDARVLRASTRSVDRPSFRNGFLGFRLARTF